MMKEWRNEGGISDGMIAHYDRRGRRTSIRKIHENISLTIHHLGDSLLFGVESKPGRTERFISSNASVMVEDQFVVTISIPESRAGLYFVFQNQHDISRLVEIVQLFTPTVSQSRVAKENIRQEDEIGQSALKRRKLQPQQTLLSQEVQTFEPKLIPKESFPLSLQQQQILQSCLDGNNIFFTGGAGTGKSTLLKYLVKKLREKYGNQAVYITATTGLAACAIGGVTIHQFGGIRANEPLQLLATRGSQVRTPTPQQTSAMKRWRQAKVLIVDEISMLGPEDLEFLDLIAKESRSSNLPMGGVQVIFTGDFFQLPPVQNLTVQEDHSKENIPQLANSMFSQSQRNYQKEQVVELRKTKYCFESPVWNHLFSQRSQSCFVLTEIYRQRDQHFISLLESVRWGNPSDSILEDINNSVGREIDCHDGILPTQLCTHRAEVDLLNSQALSSLPSDSEMREYQAIDSGDSSYLKMLQKYCPAKEKIKLKIGAQVILVKTIDSSLGLVNGAQGVVIDFTKTTKRPIVRFSNSHIHTIGTQLFSLSMGKDVIAQRIQLPLDLSWAISVHKSQGMTLERAILNLKNSWEYGQVYVAISRVRSLEGLSLRYPLKNSQIKTHSIVQDFYRDLSTTSSSITQGEDESLPILRTIR